MKLTPSTIAKMAKKTPAIYATELQDSKDILIRHKIIDVRGTWEWYIIEIDKETGHAYGMVKGFENEIGIIDLNELSELGSRIVLDVEYKSETLADLKARLKQHVA